MQAVSITTLNPPKHGQDRSVRSILLENEKLSVSSCRSPKIFTGDVLGDLPSPNSPLHLHWREERYTVSFPQQGGQGSTSPKGPHALRLPTLLALPPCVLSSQSNKLPTEWGMKNVTQTAATSQEGEARSGVQFGVPLHPHFWVSRYQFWAIDRSPQHLLPRQLDPALMQALKGVKGKVLILLQWLPLVELLMRFFKTWWW